MLVDQPPDADGKRESDAPEYISISAAVAKLKKAMFAGYERTKNVVLLKKNHSQKLSVISAGHLEQAKKIVREAAIGGSLPVYARSSESSSTFLQIPSMLLQGIIPCRNGLPDHVFQIRGDKAYCGLRPLKGYELLLGSREFAGWMKDQKDKLQWPSQQRSQRKRAGRPRLDGAWKESIIRIVEAQGPVTAAAIARHLAQNFPGSPTEDTVARILDRLFLETDDLSYRRPRRSRKITPGFEHSS